MNQAFTYQPKSSFMTKVWGIVLPVFLIVVPIVYPFSIVIGSLTLVPYPWTIALFIAIAAGVFLSFVNRMKKEKALQGVDCTITIKDGVVSYADIKKGKVVTHSFNISDIENIKEEEGDMEVRLNNSEEYTFDSDYFADKQQAAAFLSALKSSE